MKPAADEKNPSESPRKSSGGKKNPVAPAAADFEELKDRLLRVTAEFENFRRRTTEEATQKARQIKARLLEPFLPFVENLARAVSCAPAGDWEKGICQLANGFESTLANTGLKKISVTAGDNFDPTRHEAVASTGDSSEKIIEELAPGWELDGEVLQPARVKVG